MFSMGNNLVACEDSGGNFPLICGERKPPNPISIWYWELPTLGGWGCPLTQGRGASWDRFPIYTRATRPFCHLGQTNSHLSHLAGSIIYSTTLMPQLGYKLTLLSSALYMYFANTYKQNNLLEFKRCGIMTNLLLCLLSRI